MTSTIVHIVKNFVLLEVQIMKLDYTSIGKRIRQKRTEAGISQATLAELADISPQFISHIETGRKEASLPTVLAIAMVLDVSVDWLLTGSPPPSLFPASGTDSVFEDLNSYELRIIHQRLSKIRSTGNCHRLQLRQPGSAASSHFRIKMTANCLIQYDRSQGIRPSV